MDLAFATRETHSMSLTDDFIIDFIYPSTSAHLYLEIIYCIPTADMFHALETRIQSWQSIFCYIYQALIVLRSRQTQAKQYLLTSCFTLELHYWHCSESVFWRVLTFFPFISAEPHPSNVEWHSQKTVWILFYDRWHQQLCITQQRYLVLQQIFSWMTQTTWLRQKTFFFTKAYYSFEL